MNRYLPFLLTVGLMIAFRVLGSVFPEALPNFQPLAALFFCGVMLVPGWRGFMIPLGIWIATFPLGQGHNADPRVFLTTAVAFGSVCLIGKALSNRSIASILLGSIAASVVFHIVTNSAAWLGDPRYAKGFHGLWQSLWTGIPGDTLPSWVFLRNLTAANLLFTGAFLMSRVALPKAREDSPIPALIKFR